MESEVHVIVNCTLYNDIREPLFRKASVIEPTFITLTDVEKLTFLFSNETVIRDVAKVCFYILQRRCTFLYT